MSWLQFGVETIATLVETWVVILTITRILGCKYEGAVKNASYVISTFSLTFLIATINYFRIFSLSNIILSIVATVFITLFISDSTILLRLFATILAYLSIHAIDYIVSFSLGMLAETPITDTYSFSKLLEFGPLRCWYLLLDKGADILAFTAVKRHLAKIRLIQKQQLSTLLVITSFAYIIMTILLSLILSDSLMGMQVAIIFSWMFILVCVCIAIYISLLTSKYQAEKFRNEQLDICNSMMEKNYQRLHQSQRETARLVHDFNHHMGVLLELSQQQGTDEIKGYIESLLDTHYKELPMCKSGNDVINAIINCKVSEAREHHIRFQYNVNADVPSSLLPVDLCAILANQIDNAFDACKQIENQSQRAIDVHIWQTNDTLFLFQVINTVERDPMAQNPNLRTTKTDHSRPHGLGIESIRTASEKYGGTLENHFQNGKFYSTVFLNLKS